MKKVLFSMVLGFLALQLWGQSNDVSENKTSINGYGQVDLNTPLSGDEKNADLDVHRVVLLFSHRFSDKVSLVTEVEFEHVKEVYIEQAYLDYHLKPWLTFRGGLVLIPMGVINLYHESATFHSVERPLIDAYISPTTWREIGAGFTGKFLSQGIQYSAYLVNGFKSYDNGGIIGGAKAFRSGRQKGAESIMTHPNLAARIEYFKIKGLQLGLSGYFGKTQSSMYDELGEDSWKEAQADSTIVGLCMFGFDLRYQRGPWQFKGQVYQSSVKNTEEYNSFTGQNMGSALYGYYAELSYDILHSSQGDAGSLFPYLRFSMYDTHQKTKGFERDAAYRGQVLTTGLNFMPDPGTAFKIGYQWTKLGNDHESQTLQAGVAFTF